jgi:hypothetical protein
MNKTRHSNSIISDNSIDNIINSIDCVDYNDTVINLSLSILGINKEYYFNSTYDEFNNKLREFNRTKLTENQLNSIKLLLKYKKNNSSSLILNVRPPINSIPALNITQSEINVHHNNNFSLNQINSNEQEKKIYIQQIYENSIFSDDYV